MKDKKPPHSTSGQEAQWVAAAKRGDQDAFETLVHLYEKRVYALTFRLCGNPEDAQEAAQEAFLSAWQGLPFFRQESSFSTWLYRLVNNACIDLLRREKRHTERSGPSLNDEDSHLDVPDLSDSPQTTLEKAELRQAVERGLETLSTEHRTVLILREIHQLSYEEIAQTLDVDIGTVKSRINRGRKQLRRYLLKTGNFSVTSPSKETEKEGCL